MQLISSTNNSLVKLVAKYSNSASARRQEGATVLDGLHVIQEVMQRGDVSRLTHVFVTESARHHVETRETIADLPQEIVIEVSDAVMRKMAPTTTPPGILGVYRPASYSAAQLGELNFILLLDRVSDPGNLGTIIRSAVAMGVDAIFCSPGCADVWSPKVLRAAQGAHFYTTIAPNFKLETIRSVFDERIIGTFLDDSAISLYETDLSGKVGLCVGNEGGGIDPESFERYGDIKMFIPMADGFESLNVGIATGMCLSEKRRQDLIS